MVEIAPFGWKKDGFYLCNFRDKLKEEKSIYNPTFIVEDEVLDVCLVAWERGMIVGCAYLKIGNKPTSKKTAELAIAILPEWRKRGIGSDLMRNLLESARLMGLRKLWLRVYETNYPARNLYQQFGFKEEGFFEEQEWEGEVFHNIIPMGLLL